MTSEAATENLRFHTSAHTAVNQHFAHIIPAPQSCLLIISEYEFYWTLIFSNGAW